MNKDSDRISDTASQVLGLLMAGQPLSRPDISVGLNVTAPTVAAALAELSAKGFVMQTGSRQGRLGRAASMYQLHLQAGWLLGLDLGSTQILIVARALDGSLLREFRYSALDSEIAGAEPPRSLMKFASDHIVQLLSEFTKSHGRLLAVGIALARVIPNSPSTESVIGLEDQAVRLGETLAELSLPDGVPILLENNVNCAALAEMTIGSAQFAENFAYLQVGVRVGAGLVVDGKLRRGAYGGSGELSLLPFPLVPGSERQQFGLEEYLGSEHLLERVREEWPETAGAPPATSKELLDRADAGDGPARDIAHRHASDIARVAMLLSAVVDPELIVLGGGVGQNPILGGMVGAILHDVYPNIQLKVSALGERATVEGATSLAIEYARSVLLGDHYASRLGDQVSPVEQVSSAVQADGVMGTLVDRQ